MIVALCGCLAMVRTMETPPMLKVRFEHYTSVIVSRSMIRELMVGIGRRHDRLP